MSETSKHDVTSGLALRPQGSWKIRDDANGQSRQNTAETEIKDGGGGGLENTLPLSPQWLLVKSGLEKKEAQQSGTDGLGKESWRDVGKNPRDTSNREKWKTSRVDREGEDVQNSKPVDRWGDDDREVGTKLNPRPPPGRWGKEGEKETEVSRRGNDNRWNLEGAKGAEAVELPRPRNDRWGDTGRDFVHRGFEAKKETEERKEGRWGNRWGNSDEKGKDFGRPKWNDSVKEKTETGGKDLDRERNYDGDGGREKQAWRPHGRGRGEVPPTGYRPHSGYSVGRGKSEHPPPYSVGRGKTPGPYNPSTSTIGGLAEKQERWGDGGVRMQREKTEGLLQYNKAELLEYFEQMKNSSLVSQLPPNFLDVPQLTAESFLEPSAKIPVSEEEEEILTGIQKGHITSSGVVHAAKPREEDETKKSTVEVEQYQADIKAEKADAFFDSSTQEQGMNEVNARRENSRVPWRRRADTEKHVQSPQEDKTKALTNAKEASGNDPKERPSDPEKLSLFYKDPEGCTQGPFLGAEIIGWHENKFFGLDLPVKLADASPEAPFEPLGIVMPHLQKSHIVPPGFTALVATSEEGPSAAAAIEVEKETERAQDQAQAASEGPVTAEHTENMAGSDGNKSNFLPYSAPLSGPAFGMIGMPTPFMNPVPQVSPGNLGVSALPDQIMGPFAARTIPETVSMAPSLPGASVLPQTFPSLIPDSSQKFLDGLAGSQQVHLVGSQQELASAPWPNPNLHSEIPPAFGAISGQLFDSRFGHPGFSAGPMMFPHQHQQHIVPPQQRAVPLPILPHQQAQMVDYLLQSGIHPDMPLEEIIRLRQIQHQQQMHLHQMFPPPPQSVQSLGGPASHFLPPQQHVEHQQQQQQQQQQQLVQEQAQAQQASGIEEKRMMGLWEVDQFGQLLPVKAPQQVNPEPAGIQLNPEVRGAAEQFLSAEKQSHQHRGQQFEEFPHSRQGVSTEQGKLPAAWGGTNQEPGQEGGAVFSNSFALNVPAAAEPHKENSTAVAPSWHTTEAAVAPVKSLLEIQADEARQTKQEEETMRREAPLHYQSAVLQSPWKAAGGTAKPLKQILAEEALAHPKVGDVQKQVQVQETHLGLRDVIAEEVLSKMNEKEVFEEQEVEKIKIKAPLWNSAEEGGFVEAKEGKRNKKRSGKNKGAPQGHSVVTTPSKASPSVPPKREKTPAEPQLPPPPQTFLSDFIPGSPEPMQPPAWSTSFVKKGLSLMEIQEAEKKAKDEHLRQQKILEQQHKQQFQASAAVVSGPWARTLVAGKPNPILRASPVAIGKPSMAAKLKTEVSAEDEDEMFWDYKDSSGGKKPAAAAERQDYPAAGNSSVAVSTRAAVPGQIKQTAGRRASAAVAVSPAPPTVFPPLSAASVKRVTRPEKRESLGASAASANSTSRQAAATASAAQSFRLWCEVNMKRITGFSDLSLLEFCMSLPTAKEAGDYLDQYLGTSADVKSFKAEFLARKLSMPAEVARQAFPISDAVIKDDPPVLSSGQPEASVAVKVAQEPLPRKLQQSESGRGTSPAIAGGKKKGKKGKKMVDPSLLGFSSTTNRIMVGEIDHVGNA